MHIFRVTVPKVICFIRAHTYYEGKHFLVEKFGRKEFDMLPMDNIEEIIKEYPNAKLIEVPHIRSMDGIAHGERIKFHEAQEAIPVKEIASRFRY